MRKIICFLLLVFFVIAGISSMSAGKGMEKKAPSTVEVAGPIKMDKKAKVTIKGKGFKPGEELNILLTDKNGIQSDIGYALKPAPEADETGAWSTTWSCGRYIAKKLVKEGESYKITVTDVDYNPLAHTFVSFTK